MGDKTDHPCQNPAAATMPYGGPPVCEGHKLAFELGQDEDELRASLGYLERWIRAADRHNVEPLMSALRTLRDGFRAELAEIEAKQREISERHSLPPDALEQLEAKRREEGESEPLPPTSEAERRFREFDRRASRFTRAAGELEEQIDVLHARLEEEVLPLLEEEADKANEEAGRYREELGLKN